MPMNKNQRAILLGLSAATFLGPLTQTIYTPSLPEIGTFFGVSPILVNLTISLYTIILAAGNFIVGPIADIYGRRATLLPGLLIFIVGSVICFFSDSYILFYSAG
jgi:MFS family permease